MFIDTAIYKLKYKNKKYKLLLYDTCGQEKYSSMTKNYLNIGDGVLFVFSLSDKASFDDLEIWYNNYKKEKENVIGVLIGNKSDDNINRKVSNEDSEEFARKYNLKYFESSAKLDKNIKKAIIYLLKEIVSKQKSKNTLQTDSFITINSELSIRDKSHATKESYKNKKKKCC